MESAFGRGGSTRKTILLPPCDSVESPLCSLFMNEESSKNPTENLSGSSTPLSPVQQKVADYSKKKLDLQFESLSGKTTPEGDPKTFQKLQTYWEKKSGGMSDLSVLNSDTEPENSHKIIPATADSSISKSIDSACSLVKTYTQLVLNSSNNASDESLLESKKNDIPYHEESNVSVCTPAPKTSLNDSKMAPASEEVRPTRQSRSRDKTPVQTPRSKSTGDISSSAFSPCFSVDDLTPKIHLQRKNRKQTRPRRLLSLDPNTYSQLISSDKLALSTYETRNSSRGNGLKKSVQDISTFNADERKVTEDVPVTDQNQPVTVNDSWPDIIETPEINKLCTGKTESERKASIETINLADISEIQLENTSMRELNDSTFIGDITFDLRGMSALTDESYPSYSQTFEQSSLAGDVKGIICDIVDEFVKPGFLSCVGEVTPTSIKDRDLQDIGEQMGEINYEDYDHESIFGEFVDIAVQMDNLVQRAQQEDHSEKVDIVSAVNVTDLVNNLDENVDCHGTPAEQPETLFSKLENESCSRENVWPTPENGTMVQDNINHLIKDFSPCYSPDLRCNESPVESPQYVNRDMNWSPTLSITETSSVFSKIWTDTENKPQVLRKRSNLKRPRKLVFDTPENDRSLEDSEPSPKLAKTPVVLSNYSQSEKFMKGVSYPESLKLTIATEQVHEDSDTSYSSCDTCDALYIDTSTSSGSSDSDFSYSQNIPQISIKDQGETKKGRSHTPPTDCPSPILQPPYTRFSSPSYSSDEERTELFEAQRIPKRNKKSPSPDITRLPYWSLDSHGDYVESVMVNNKLSGDFNEFCGDTDKHKVVHLGSTEKILTLNDRVSKRYLGTAISKNNVNDNRDIHSFNNVIIQNQSDKQQALFVCSEVGPDTRCPSKNIIELSEPPKYEILNTEIDTGNDIESSVQTRSVNGNEVTHRDKQNCTEIPDTYQPNLLQNYHRDSGFCENMPLYNTNWNSSPAMNVEETLAYHVDTSGMRQHPPSVFGTVYNPLLSAQPVNCLSYWTDYNGDVAPRNQVSDFAQNYYNNVQTMKYWDQNYYIETKSPTSQACLYTGMRTETYLLPDSMFNSTVTIPLQQSTPAEKFSQTETYVTPVQQIQNSNNPVQTPSTHREPEMTQPSNGLEMKTGGNTNRDHKNKRSGGIFGMMAHSIKKKLTNKFCKPGSPNNPLESENFELFDSLKHCHPYLISGWLSSTYLMSLVNKEDVLNRMFQEPLDSSGHIHQWIVDTCRKNTAAIFARDLVFRVFTLLELNNFNMVKLNRRKMAAIRKCVKEHFPAMTKWNWKSKCIPLIKSSVNTLFKHRVRQVQLFLMMHSRTDPDRTKYIGALCGLGSEAETGYPLLPDHDIELPFDVKFKTEDIKDINAVRLAINLAIGTQSVIASWSENAVFKIQKSARNKLMELVQKRRESCEVESPANMYQWNQVDKDDILDPKVEGYDNQAIFSLHSGVSIQGEDLMSSEQNQQKEHLRKHAMELREIVRRNERRLPTLCELCNLTCPTNQLLALHLETQNHKKLEEKL